MALHAYGMLLLLGCLTSYASLSTVVPTWTVYRMQKSRHFVRKTL